MDNTKLQEAIQVKREIDRVDSTIQFIEERLRQTNGLNEQILILAKSEHTKYPIHSRRIVKLLLATLEHELSMLEYKLKAL